VLGPEWREVDILANFTPTVHLDGFSLELWEFEFDRAAGVGGRYFELQFELVSDEVVGAGADSLPANSILAGLNFEPVVILLLIGLDVGDDGPEFLLEAVLPLLVLGPRVHCQQRNIVGSLLNGTDHLII